MGSKNNQITDIILPKENENVAVTFDVPLTAALIYDKIWWPYIYHFVMPYNIPDEIRFFGGTDFEYGYETFNAWMCLCYIISKDSNLYESVVKKAKDKTVYADIIKHFRKNEPPLRFIRNFDYSGQSLIDIHKLESMIEEGCLQRFFRNVNQNIIGAKSLSALSNMILRDLSKNIKKKYNFPVTTIYSNIKTKNKVYAQGDKDVIICTIKNLNIVDENKLTVEQVLEFRKDKVSQNKYKRFTHWLDKEMIGKSQSFIEDEMALRLEDYKDALKKHGVKTIIGILEEVLSGDFLKNSALTSGIIGLTTEPIFGLLAGAGLVVSNVAIKLAKNKLDYEEIEKGSNSEISWVYEVKKLSK